MGDAAPQHVGEPAVSMRRHRDQIAALTLSGGRDLSRGISAGKQRFDLEAFTLERVRYLLDVFAIVRHFPRLAELELDDVPRHPSIVDVNQNDRRAGT